MNEVIKVETLTKAFDNTVVVDAVSLAVNEGEIYGFLGLNGAGKTTTIRMLLGMVKPNKGEIRLFGKRMGFTSEVWNKVGYLVETPCSYPNLSVRENLEVILHYRKSKQSESIGEIIERLHLSQFENKKAAELSMGNLQRLGLAKALMHKPKLLILDEPINGLDPAGIVEVREMLKSLAQAGSTIFLSSHILNEVSLLAARIGIINEGKMVKELDARQLDSYLKKEFVLDTADNQGALSFLQERGIIASMGDDFKIRITDSTAFEDPAGVTTLLVEAKFSPRELHLNKEDLESFFLRVIKRSS